MRRKSKRYAKRCSHRWAWELLMLRIGVLKPCIPPGALSSNGRLDRQLCIKHFGNYCSLKLCVLHVNRKLPVNNELRIPNKGEVAVYTRAFVTFRPCSVSLQTILAPNGSKATTYTVGDVLVLGLSGLSSATLVSFDFKRATVSSPTPESRDRRLMFTEP